MTGGIIAVAYTDLAQLGLMLLGMVVLLPLAWHEAGGWTAISAAVPAQNLTAWAPGKAVVWGWILAVLPGQMVLQVYHQRIFAARSERVAKRGLLYLALSCLLAGVWATLLGLALRTLNPGLADRDTAVIWCVRELLHPAVAMIVLGAAMAAIVSTADSALHSASASITRDFYQGLIRPDTTDAKDRGGRQATDHLQKKWASHTRPTVEARTTSKASSSTKAAPSKPRSSSPRSAAPGRSAAS